jgi:hypothetical protein
LALAEIHRKIGDEAHDLRFHLQQALSPSQGRNASARGERFELMIGNDVQRVSSLSP